MSIGKGTLLVLGPQRPRPNLSAAFAHAGGEGPLAIITAGWRHDESELDALKQHLPVDGVHLPLYRWFDTVMAEHPDLKARYRARQDRVLAFKRLYQIRLSAAFRALIRLGRSPADAPDLHAAELDDAVQSIRQLDSRMVSVLDQIREESGPLDWRLDAVRPYHDAIRERLDRCRSLAIAGGHVAVLLNRLRFFGVDQLIPDLLTRGGVVAGWSAGAMVLCDRVVLFYDDPPEGRSEPEILDRGLGLVDSRLVFPHARRRLRLDNPERLELLEARFGRCIGLDNGAWVRLYDGGFEDLSEPGSCTVLSPTEGAL